MARRAVQGDTRDRVRRRRVRALPPTPPLPPTTSPPICRPHRECHRNARRLRSSQHRLPQELRRTRGTPTRVPIGGPERPEIVAVEVAGPDPFIKQASKQAISRESISHYQRLGRRKTQPGYKWGAKINFAGRFFSLSTRFSPRRTPATQHFRDTRCFKTPYRANDAEAIGLHLGMTRILRALLREMPFLLRLWRMRMSGSTGSTGSTGTICETLAVGLTT